MAYAKRPRDSFRSKTITAASEGWREIHRKKLTKNFREDLMRKRVSKVLDADIMVERVPNVYTNCDRVVAAAADDNKWPHESLVDRLARLGIRNTHAAHGREYAYNYVHLVDRLVGRDAGKIMRTAFKKHGVKYSKKRELTDEQKAETVERLLSAKTEKIIAELSERISKGEL